VKIKKSDKGYQFTVDGKDYDIVNYSKHENIISFTFNKESYNIYYAQDKDMIYLATGGEYYAFVSDRGGSMKGRRTHGQMGNSVSSPMPGLLVKIMVAVGDNVKQGTTLAIVEAMKMQNELRAPRDGIVRQINNREGDQVDALKPIVELT